jgi:hypothetical protein
LARLLNNETGRGTMNKTIRNANKFISVGIWSPRLMASRINILGLGELSGSGYYRNLSPEVRKMAAVDLANFIVTGSLMMAGLALMGGEADLDPRSQTFGTVKIGTRTYNIWGGFTQYVRLFAQNAFQEKVKQGKTVDFEKVKTADGVGTTTWEEALRFGRGKLNPFFSTVVNVADGQDYMGKPNTPASLATNLAVPLSLREIPDIIKRDGVAGLYGQWLWQFQGVGVYDDRDFVPKKRTVGAPPKPKAPPKPPRPK